MAAETAVAMPLLLLLILLAVQFGIWAHTVHVAQATAAEALSAARLDGATAADGQARAQAVRQQLGPHTLADAHIQITRGPDTVTVQVTGTAPRVVPLPFLHLPVRAHAAGPVERFRPNTVPTTP
ncbi:TadE/TadG family type IV pilus assembly protein [Actinomadura rupiterrae]|uniref:TadE/TadG family type IV pilus assembly protein n=1 Tax=Actinomadura rupiterrae TaxID=559627 RepID=UPI0020A52A0F|nr:TadE/TadG family type IV pilus assembly protein [Actinomadura rupiterrae]MCP2338913.1 Flp pilus assembly protein TadG [Actinomadura rupiterrae]